MGNGFSSGGARSPGIFGRSMRSMGRTGAFRLFDFTLIISALAIAGVPLPARIGVSALALITAAWVLFSRQRQGRRVVIGLPGLALALLLIWTWLQWIPLPAGFIEWLSPASAAARIETAQALGVAAPSTHALSFDRALTAQAWVGLLGVLAVYLAAANLGRSVEERRRIGQAIVVTALATIAIALVHAMLGLTQIYGIYEASIEVSALPFVSPFVNPNHAAALMLLGALIALGLAFPGRDEVPRPRWMIAWMALALGVIASLSRANTALLIIGLLSLGGILAWRGRRGPDAARVGRIIIGTAGAAAVAVVVFLSPERWLGEMMSVADAPQMGAEGTFLAWDIGRRAAFEFWPFGVGHGAFSAVSPGLTDDWSIGLVAYAHNTPLQAVIDWGLPMALLGGLLLTFGTLRAGWLRRKDAAALGALVGLFAVGLQNMADFSLSFPGVAFPAAAALGWIVGDHSSNVSASKKRSRLDLRMRWPLWLSAVLAGSLFLTSYDAWLNAPSQWDTRLRTALSEGQPRAVPIDKMLLAHSSDFHLARMASIAAGRSGDAEMALTLADRAVRLAPHEAATRLTRGRLRLEAGAVEAGMVDLAKVAMTGPKGVDSANAEALRFAHIEGVLATHFAVDPERAVRAARRLNERGDRDAARQLLGWAAERFPDHLALREAHALLLMDVARKRPAGAGERVYLDRLSTDFLARGAQGGPDEKAWRRLAFLAQAVLFEGKGKHTEAFHAFRAAAELDSKAAAWPLLQAGRVLRNQKRWDQLESMLPDLDRATRPLKRPRARYLVLKSDLAEARGNLRLALQTAQQALRAQDQDPRIRDRIANLLDALGDTQSAKAERARAHDLRAQAKARSRRALKLPDMPPKAAAPKPTEAVPGSEPVETPNRPAVEIPTTEVPANPANPAPESDAKAKEDAP